MSTLTKARKKYCMYQLQNMDYMVEPGRDENEGMMLITGNYITMNDISGDLTSLPYFAGALSTANNIVRKITINNLYSHSTDKLYFGLFRRVINGNISNINLIISNDRSVSNVKYKGAFCGSISSGQIQNCSSSGTLTANSSSKLTSETGGIAGRMTYGTILGCSSNITINSYGRAGGFVGYVSYGSIRNCTYNGRINMYYQQNTVTAVDDNATMGGIVGMLNGGTVISCCASVNMVISYESGAFNEKNLKPCLGYIVGRKISGTISGAVVDNNSTILTNNLKDENGFLGIGRYKQLDYVSQDHTQLCGRAG